MDSTTQALMASSGFIALLVVLMLWSSVWKGFALYRAGANKSVPWFIVLFILNTAGILEILYLFVFSKKRGTTSSEGVAELNETAEDQN